MKSDADDHAGRSDGKSAQTTPEARKPPVR